MGRGKMPRSGAIVSFAGPWGFGGVSPELARRTSGSYAREDSMRKRVESALMLPVGWALAVACASTGYPESQTIGVSEPAAEERRATPPGTSADAATAAPTTTTPEKPSRTATDGRASVPDDFPAGTRSLQVREIAHVLGAPMDRAPYIGKVTAGTRVGWQRAVLPGPEDPAITKTRRRRKGEPCPTWVEIRPNGWLCKSLLAPSPEEPHGVHQPVLQKGRLTPDDYFKVMADETKVYKTADDVRANVVEKLLSTKVMLVGLGDLHVDDTPYLKTDHGLIEAAALGKFWPSDFKGLNLREGPPLTWPFAWTFFERGGRKPPIYGEPAREGPRIRDAARREIVQVLEERNGFVRIGDAEWIERKHLRLASISAPPAQLSAGAQWIDVDLDEQVLVAYEGDKPVFVTLVSTGGPKHPTPVATYRVQAKAATTPMAGDPKVPNRYEVSAVPWAIRFANGLFVHGVYWHDGFGGARSHGCVNVSPKDAAFLFEWVNPMVPEGWSEFEVPSGTGVIVRVRDRQNPNPPLFDYTRDAPRAAVAL
jgi:L,D-transpeptidase catalytic domain